MRLSQILAGFSGEQGKGGGGNEEISWEGRGRVREEKKGIGGRGNGGSAEGGDGRGQEEGRNYLLSLCGSKHLRTCLPRTLP